MAATKLSGLSAGAAVASTDLFYGVQTAGAGGVKTTAAQLKTFMSASPTLVTPVLGVASATSINKLAITAPATSATLAIADGKTLTVSNTITFQATDGTTVNFGAGGTFAYTGNDLSVFAATTSAQLAGVISDETGTGTLVFATTPTLVTPILGVATGTSLSLGGATIGSDALGVTGTATFNGGATINSASLSLVSSPLSISGNISAASWGGATVATLTGLRIKSVSGTLTDTTSSGTVVISATDLLGGNTIAASAATTFTNYYSMYFKIPVAGTNVTFAGSGNGAWGVGADNARFGSLTSATTISTTGAIGQIGAPSNALNGGLKVASGSGASEVGLNWGGVGYIGACSVGLIGFTSSSADGTIVPDAAFSRVAAANIRHGKASSATPVAQTLTVGEASRPGTDTNIGGATGTVQSGLGTGTGTLSSLLLQSPKAAASGTSAQTYVTGLTILAGTAVLANYTVANLPSATTAGAGATAFVTDANTTFVLGLGVAVVGGGANKVPVYSDGTNWIVG